ncbi:MAG: ATP-binding cassette domain-containing protein [Acetobacteraceae bacterium]
MLQLSAAGKRFGPKLLFEDANWLITPDERTGLVGGNGTGKSTLLKILAGLETLDYGALTSVKGMTIGYLPQDGLALSGRTVFAECLSVFDHLHALEREAEEITHTLSTADPESREYRAAADRYSDIANHLHVHDIYTLDSQVGAVLGGLGFAKQDWERPTEEFSGGWQMRISLAKLLLQKPSLLLLDEPTNHLDLESRNWLENYLHDYPNAYILVSHDRYFLDVTVSKTIEIWNKRIHTYHGNYEKYLTQKEERRATLMAAYKNQRDRIEQLEAFINRFRYQATKAKQVQSRIKELEKIERIEVPEEEATIHFTIPQPPASGRTVIEVSHLSKDYPMPLIDGQPAGVNHVLIDVGFQINRLAREDEACCRLIKACAAFDTLLADQDGLYHPLDFNDRLVLSIKGLMGGFELHQIQQRMQAARLNRARRGEWLGSPPPGYIVGPDHKLQFDPDEQIQSFTRLLLDQFASIDETVRRFNTYRSAMIENGFGFHPHQVGVARAFFVADTQAEKDAAIERRMAAQRRLHDISQRPDQNNTASIMAFSDTREANEEATLFGSPDDIIAKIQRLREQGVEYILLNGGGTSRVNLRRFAREVMPAFKGETKRQAAE